MRVIAEGRRGEGMKGGEQEKNIQLNKNYKNIQLIKMNVKQLLSEWEISLLIQYNSSINVVSTQRNNIEDTSS